MTPDGTRRESPGTRASICCPSILIVTSRPGPTVAKGRLRSGSGRLPRSVGTQSSQPGAKGSRRVDPTHGAMSQRQVLQGRELWAGAPTGWRRGGDGGGAAAPPYLSPQCSSCTRMPGPGSYRWWQSRRPDLRTSRHCRMRVSLNYARHPCPTPHPSSILVLPPTSSSLTWSPVAFSHRCQPHFLAPLPAQLLGVLGMGLSEATILRTLSSLRELVE